jgi:hypothetical protein
VSSRLAEKQRRRAEREARERELAARERRARRLRIAGGVVAGVVLVAGAAVLTVLGSGSDKEAPPPESSQPFGQHYDGLEQRRAAANVATMAAPSGTEHTHQRLSIWVNDTPVAVPADIGIDPREPESQMAALHTHEEPGLIHNEGQANPTLGQFFAVWGVPLSKDRLGPHRAGGGNVVQMWVDGKPSQAWGSLKLTDRQDIRITFGPRSVTPPEV